VYRDTQGTYLFHVILTIIIDYFRICCTNREEEGAECVVKVVYYREKRKRKTVIVLNVTGPCPLVFLVKTGCRRNRVLRGSGLLDNNQLTRKGRNWFRRSSLCSKTISLMWWWRPSVCQFLSICIWTYYQPQNLLSRFHAIRYRSSFKNLSSKCEFRNSLQIDSHDLLKGVK